MNSHLSSLLEELKDAGLDVSSARVATTTKDRKLHLSDRNDTPRCSFPQVGRKRRRFQRLGSLVARRDLCPLCFEERMCSLAHVPVHPGDDWKPTLALSVLRYTEESASVLSRLKSGRGLGSGRAPGLSMRASRLREVIKVHQGFNPTGPSSVLLDELERRVVEAETEFLSAACSEANRSAALRRVVKLEAGISDRARWAVEAWRHDVEPDVDYLVGFGGGFESFQSYPTVAQDALVAYSVPCPPGRFAAVVPGTVMRYLLRVQRLKQVRYTCWTEHVEAPGSDVLVEVTLGLWEPGTRSEASSLAHAAEMAKLLCPEE